MLTHTLIHVRLLGDMPLVNLRVTWSGKHTKDYFLSDKVVTGSSWVYPCRYIYIYVRVCVRVCVEQPTHVQSLHDDLYLSLQLLRQVY